MFFLCRRAWKTHEMMKEQHNETQKVGLSSLFNVSNEEKKTCHHLKFNLSERVKMYSQNFLLLL